MRSRLADRPQEPTGRGDVDSLSSGRRPYCRGVPESDGKRDFKNRVDDAQDRGKRGWHLGKDATIPGADTALLPLLGWVISVAGSGLLGGAVWDGAKRIAKSVQSIGRSTFQTVALREQEVLTTAHDAIQERFGVGRSETVLLSVTVREASANVVLRGTDGSVFTVFQELDDEGNWKSSVTRACTT